MSRTVDAEKPRVTVSLGQVAALFEQSFKRPPTKAQCYHLMNDINIVRNAKPAKVLNDDRS
jgi:hypothetical protein